MTSRFDIGKGMDVENPSVLYGQKIISKHFLPSCRRHMDLYPIHTGLVRYFPDLIIFLAKIIGEPGNSYIENPWGIRNILFAEKIVHMLGQSSKVGSNFHQENSTLLE